MNCRAIVLLALATLLLSACGGGQTASDPEVVALGQAVYDANCAACHGPQGEGQPNWRVPDENGIFPAPPHDSSGHTWHHPDDLLLQIIAEGGMMPNSGMPGYEGQLSQEEMEAVLVYIKTFWGEQERRAQSQMSQ